MLNNVKYPWCSEIAAGIENAQQKVSPREPPSQLCRSKLLLRRLALSPIFLSVPKKPELGDTWSIGPSWTFYSRSVGSKVWNCLHPSSRLPETFAATYDCQLLRSTRSLCFFNGCSPVRSQLWFLSKVENQRTWMNLVALLSHLTNSWAAFAVWIASSSCTASVWQIENHPALSANECQYLTTSANKDLLCKTYQIVSDTYKPVKSVNNSIWVRMTLTTGLSRCFPFLSIGPFIAHPQGTTSSFSCSGATEAIRNFFILFQ